MGDRIHIASGVGIEEQQFQNLMIFKVFKAVLVDKPLPQLFPVPEVRILFGICHGAVLLSDLI